MRKKSRCWEGKLHPFCDFYNPCKSQIASGKIRKRALEAVEAQIIKISNNVNKNCLFRI